MQDAIDFTFMCKERPEPNGRKAAIVGAGPSGLAAAGYLACKGFEVHVYDKLPTPGGLMVFGIPGHRIPAERIEAGARLMESRGVAFHMKTKITGSKALHEETGDDFSDNLYSLSDMAADHDAVIICTGTWSSRAMGVPGEDLPGVYTSLEFLFPIRAAQYDSSKLSPVDVQGKRVAVVGAGHSAIDAAESALAQGAEEVFLCYRRTRRDAPCGEFEIDCCVDHGIVWKELESPTRVVGDGKVEGLELVACEMAPGGKSQPKDACAPSILPVDVIITAIGDRPSIPFARQLGVENLRRGEAHWLQMTSMDGVFVAGDALTGPSKIGKAIYSGLRAARSLTHWLSLREQGRESEYSFAGDLVGDALRV